MLTGADSREVSSTAQCIKIIEAANHNRVTSSTAMNDQSSRSHSVLVLEVVSRVGSKVGRDGRGAPLPHAEPRAKANRPRDGEGSAHVHARPEGPHARANPSTQGRTDHATA